jgi:TRAP-type C4-dicarboxylate transport system substrate-binding protein
MIRLAAVCLALLSTVASAAVDVTAGGTGTRNTRGEEKWLLYEKNVEARSAGAINMTMLIYGELGIEENLVSGIRRGRIHVANWSGAVATTVVPETAVLYVPFLFDDFAESDFVMDKYLFEAYSKLYADKDVHLLSWDEIGFSKVWSKAPILTPADAKGKRFRVSANEASRLFAESVGADVIPLGFADIISSLQTGLIEAGETGAVLYARTGIAEAAPHITNTDHNFATSLIVIRKSWLDRLPPEQKKVMIDSWVGLETSRQWVREEVAGDLAAAAQRGFTVHDITKEQRDLWRRATSAITKRLLDTAGPEAQRIWDLAQEGKKAYAARQSK